MPPAVHVYLSQIYLSRCLLRYCAHFYNWVNVCENTSALERAKERERKRERSNAIECNFDDVCLNGWRREREAKASDWLHNNTVLLCSPLPPPCKVFNGVRINRINISGTKRRKCNCRNNTPARARRHNGARGTCARRRQRLDHYWRATRRAATKEWSAEGGAGAAVGEEKQRNANEEREERKLKVAAFVARSPDSSALLFTPFRPFLEQGKRGKRRMRRMPIWDRFLSRKAPSRRGQCT